MSDILTSIECILKEEKKIFNEIYKLEGDKSEAIIDRDGNLLHKISTTQEEHLAEIQILEEKRKEIIKLHRAADNTENPTEITLSNIISNEKPTNDELIKMGDCLRKTLQKIKSLQDINSKLINDNMEFYNTLIKELKESVTLKTGYSQKGIENEEVSNSLIFNGTF